MERIGLVDRIVISAIEIYQGRRWLDTDGMEYEGRAAYRRGLASAMECFNETQSAADEDLELLIRAEYTFVEQELLFCDKEDTQASSSLRQAAQYFDDALLSLEAVSGDAYTIADKTYPRSGKHRLKGMPKDSFHHACIGHCMRLSNILRSPGINRAEKQLLIQRLANMKAAQNAYHEKQRKALEAVSLDNPLNATENSG